MAQDPDLAWDDPYDFNGEKTVVIRHQLDKYLRIDPQNHGQLDENGGTGGFARWIVNIKNDGTVQLRSEKSNKFLRIHGGDKIDVNGGGGKFCDFRLHKRNVGVYKLESVEFPRKFIAVDRKGIRTGPGGPWTELDFFMQGAPPPQNVTWSKPYNFQTEKIIVIQHPLDKYIRIDPQNNNQVNADGGTGELARWSVKLVENDDIVQFQNTKSGKCLRIHGNGDKVDVGGGGGKFCNFKVHKQQNGVYKLESVEFNNKFIAIDKNGIRTGAGGPWCRLEFYKQGAKGVFQMKYQFKANKKVVVIEHTHDGTIRVSRQGNEVWGNGGRGKNAHWEVELFDNGSKIKLKSVRTGKYLRIHGNDVDAEGSGGPWTEFALKDGDTPNIVKLESIKMPGKYVAVNADQVVKVGAGGPHCELTFWRND